MSELREVIGALQSEVEFEAAVRELGAAGIDQARIGFLAQEEIAASRAGAVGCDIKQLPPRRDRLERRPAAGSHACDLARGHCRVVRRRRPGGDFGSGRASSANPTEGDILGAWAGIILDSADGRELARCKPAGGAAGSRG